LFTEEIIHTTKQFSTALTLVWQTHWSTDGINVQARGGHPL